MISNGDVESVTFDLWKNTLSEKNIERIKGARITIIIGASDTGKTTLIKFLANEISRSGRSCGIIDADLGQSDIGPPTTIGMGGVYKPLESISQVEVKGIYFVGSVSPKGHLLPTVIGTKRMVDKALKIGFDHILIDTTGLIQGSLGETLKAHKVELIQPDLIIVLQRQSECEHLVRRFRTHLNQNVIVLTPPEEVRNKPPSERREFRERAILAYFSNSSIKKLSLKDSYLVDFQLFLGPPFSEKERNVLSKKINNVVLWAESQNGEIHLVTLDPVINLEEKPLGADLGKNILFNYTLDEFESILVGLYDRWGECYSLGIVRKIDFSTQQVEVEVAEDKEVPCGIKFSRYRINQNGSGCFLPRKTPINQGLL